jgi:hypothetical protein
MLRTDWISNAEGRLETLRKRAEVESDRLKVDFPQWPSNDVRRWAVIRFSTGLFLPTVGLCIMRLHLSEAAWWEQYARGSGQALLEPGRTAFDQTVKAKLILDLVGNLEHSFRLILRHLDPSNNASNFASIYNSLLRTTKPYLDGIPSEWKPQLELLRRVRNSIHNAWMYSPEDLKDFSTVYRGKTLGTSKKGQVLYLVSASVCQPADRRVVQVHYICHLSLAISVTMYRLDNPGVPFDLGELPFKQVLQCRSA